tara:strand:+ start:64 stop:1752 length:1689 start_codon:yes stop_codon:yes gene_type:complete
MATELEVKAKERKELLDEIRKRRAAKAYGDSVVGAAERGDYGDVGQGEKGPFDDEIDQDPGNPLENLMEYQAGDVSQLDLTKAQRGVLPKSPIDDAIRRGLGFFFRKSPIGLALTYGPEIAQSVKNFMMPVRQADTGTGITFNMADLGSKSKALDQQVTYNPQKNYDEFVENNPQKSVKISSTVDEPDLSKLEVTGTDGKAYVLVGNRIVPKEMAEIRGYVLKEGDRATPRISYNYVLKDRADLIREKSGTGTVMVGRREVPYENTILVTGTDGRTYRIINPDSYKVPIKEAQNYKEKFLDYYKTNFTDEKSLVKIANNDSKFRFLDNIRRTTPDIKNVDDFFSNYSMKDLDEGGKLYRDFLKFKAIDDVRIENVNEIRPILQKIFSQVTGKESRATLQLAHKFETSGIAKKYVSPDKYGKGSDPTELYLDISEYNSVLQKGYEAEARALYKKFLDKGSEADFKKLQQIDKDMRILGIQGEIAPGQQIGQAMAIDDKIRQIADEALKNKFITEVEYDKAIKVAENMADAKIKYFDTFGTKMNLAKGGLATMEHMTRPLDGAR